MGNCASKSADKKKGNSPPPDEPKKKKLTNEDLIKTNFGLEPGDEKSGGSGKKK